MQPPEITFIVPCYNYGRYLGQCLESIYSQIGAWNVEVLVIDDASTDDSWKIICESPHPIKACRNPTNKGHAQTLTDGLLRAGGDLIARIDPDDRLRPSFLQRTVPVLRKYPEVALVYGDVAMIDDSGRITAAGCDTQHDGRDFKGNEFIALLKQNFICAPTVLARRNAWLEALPIPPGLAFNDWHFTTMMARRHQFYYVQDVLAEYRIHAANLHSEIARSGQEEASVMRVLDRYFAEVEVDPELENAKRLERGAIYASNYLIIARKYFGLGQSANARRCKLRP
jgi:glycosyltransferase involved in cell wall biosynthesis